MTGREALPGSMDERGTATSGLGPSASLIISSRDRPAFLERVIESILAGAQRPTELIVIDQSAGPNARMRALAAEHEGRVRYHWTQDRGLSRGRNAGIALAHGEWLVFVDDDVVVPSDWFGRIVRAAVDAGPRAVITGRVIAGDPERPGGFVPAPNPSSIATVHRGRPGRDVLPGVYWAMHHGALAEVGDFDVRLGAGSHFPGAEDNDFGFRLLEAGFAIIYDPSIVLIHRAWRTPIGRLRLRWNYGRGQGAFYAKHLTLRDQYMLRRLWTDLRRHVRRAPRRVLSNPRDGADDLIYSAALVASVLEWLITRPRP